MKLNTFIKNMKEISKRKVMENGELMLVSGTMSYVVDKRDFNMNTLLAVIKKII